MSNHYECTIAFKLILCLFFLASEATAETSVRALVTDAYDGENDGAKLDHGSAAVLAVRAA